MLVSSRSLKGGADVVRSGRVFRPRCGWRDAVDS